MRVPGNIEGTDKVYVATWAALSKSSTIMVRKNVAEILHHHVTFELEAIDRMSSRIRRLRRIHFRCTSSTSNRACCR